MTCRISPRDEARTSKIFESDSDQCTKTWWGKFKSQMQTVNVVFSHRKSQRMIVFQTNRVFQSLWLYGNISSSQLGSHSLQENIHIWTHLEHAPNFLASFDKLTSMCFSNKTSDAERAPRQVSIPLARQSSSVPVAARPQCKNCGQTRGHAQNCVTLEWRRSAHLGRGIAGIPNAWWSAGHLTVSQLSIV